MIAARKRDCCAVHDSCPGPPTMDRDHGADINSWDMLIGGVI